MDWTQLLRDDPALADATHHAEALTRAATRLLRENRPHEAARLLGRRLAAKTPPAPAEHALSALACALAGRPDEAAGALDRALEADPLDPAVGLVALRLARTREERRTAARRLLAGPATPDDAVASALAALWQAGEEAAVRLDLRDGRLSGWIAWHGEPAPFLVLRHLAGETRQALPPDDGPGFAPAGSFATFVALETTEPIVAYEIRRDGAVLLAGTPSPRSRYDPVGRGTGVPAAVPDRRSARIVVPVFADPDSAVEALGAAILEARREPGTQIVVVDDASPDPAVRRLLDVLSWRALIELRRNAVNLGFTGAVMRGLDGLGERDALILNSDAILPPGALRRLRDTVYSAPDIGSATPLSNNGEWTSLPCLARAAPLPTPGEAAMLDEAARAAGAAPVDLPNGIGFALYLRHDALAAAGGLSAVYERGYFEDAELTLRLRAVGFRNVAATDLVVPHHGSRSFGETKTMLVARNLRRLRRRFPSIREESAAFRQADPLAPVRAALERQMPPDDYPLLLVAPCGSALADERLARHDGRGQPSVALRWRRSGAALLVELRGSRARAPQSLGFDLAHEAPALRDWLVRLDPGRIELAGGVPPEPLADAILAVPGAIAILAGDLHGQDGAAAPLLAGFESWRERLPERWLEVVASDQATLAALRRRLAGGPDADRIDADLAPSAAPSAAEGKAAAPVLAVVMGVPSPRSLLFAQRLQASLRVRLGAAARCATIGVSTDDLALIRAGVDAHGAVPRASLAARLRAMGARALVLPPEDPSLAFFDRLAAETALPVARLDWSEGAETAPAPALLLPRSPGESDLARAVVDWFAGRLAP